MIKKLNKIEFEKLGGPLYSGRDRGAANREKLQLDKHDLTDEVIEVIVPDKTYSINSSFFMALFGASVRTLGSREKFLNKYKFTMPDKFNEKIDNYIERALRDKTPLI